MNKFPDEIKYQIYKFDPTFYNIFQNTLTCINHFNLNYIKSWYEKRFDCKTIILSIEKYSITLFDHKKIVKLHYSEQDLMFFITFYNIKLGSWKNYAIVKPCVSDYFTSIFNHRNSKDSSLNKIKKNL